MLRLKFMAYDQVHHVSLFMSGGVSLQWVDSSCDLVLAPDANSCG
jgi:hypothetical protein